MTMDHFSGICFWRPLRMVVLRSIFSNFLLRLMFGLLVTGRIVRFSYKSWRSLLSIISNSTNTPDWCSFFYIFCSWIAKVPRIWKNTLVLKRPVFLLHVPTAHLCSVCFCWLKETEKAILRFKKTISVSFRTKILAFSSSKFQRLFWWEFCSTGRPFLSGQFTVFIKISWIHKWKFSSYLEGKLVKFSKFSFNGNLMQITTIEIGLFFVKQFVFLIYTFYSYKNYIMNRMGPQLVPVWLLRMWFKFLENTKYDFWFQKFDISFAHWLHICFQVLVRWTQIGQF